MAYNYLIDLYTYLEEHIEAARRDLDSGHLTPEEAAYQQGQVDLWLELEEFLKANYNKMLPSKIRKRLEEQGPAGIN